MRGVVIRAWSPSVLAGHLAAALAAPQQGRVGPVLVELHHHRAAVELRHQQVVVADHGGGDGHAGPGLPLLVPVDLPGLGVQRHQGRRVPDDELPRPAGLDDDGLAVAHLADDVEGTPDLLAGPLVPRHDEAAGLAADHRDQPVAVDDGRAGHPPGGDEAVVVGDVVLLPQDVAGLDVEAVEVAGGADHVDAVAVDGRGGARADGVREHQHAVGGGPLLHPQHLAGLLVEGEGPLGAVHRPRLGVLGPVGDEDAPVGHRRAGVARVDGHPPCHLQLVGQRLDDAGLGPLPAPVLAAPLRPVVGEAGGGHQQGECREGQGSKRAAGRTVDVVQCHCMLLARLVPPEAGRARLCVPFPVKVYTESAGSPVVGRSPDSPAGARGTMAVEGRGGPASTLRGDNRWRSVPSSGPSCCRRAARCVHGRSAGPYCREVPRWVPARLAGRRGQRRIVIHAVNDYHSRRE